MSIPIPPETPASIGIKLKTPIKKATPPLKAKQVYAISWLRGFQLSEYICFVDGVFIIIWRSWVVLVRSHLSDREWQVASDIISNAHID